MIWLFIPLLTTLFIYLKLVGSIMWSWWWVLSPVWIGIPLGILVSTLLGLLVMTIFK